MQHTNGPTCGNVDPKETPPQTKKCHLCELDRYLSDFVYLKGDICVEINICVSCNRELIADKKRTLRALRRYSLV